MRHAGLLLGAVLVWAGCDPGRPARDASTPPSQKLAEVSVRVDAPAGGNPSVSVLAFRAQLVGTVPDVLGVVDPLVAAAPEGRCELREVAAAARTLRARGGAVELESLGNVALDLGGVVLRPAARVYPQLAAVVGGVVGEAGPSDVTSLPESMTLSLGDGERQPLAWRGLPRLLDGEGQALLAGARLDPTADLALRVEGPAHSFIELRPYGAAQALACPAGAGGRVVVPHELLAELLAASGRVPVSIEAVWRESQYVGATHATHVSVEARSSAVLELAP